MKSIFKYLNSFNSTLKNFILIGLINVISLMNPLIITPHLIKIFGVSKYGIVIIGIGVVNFITSILDYGFNLLGPKLILENADNKKQMSIEFSAIYFTKAFLFIPFAIIIFFFIHYFYPSLNNILVLVGILIYIIGKTINLNWIFNTFEDNHINFLINFLVRTLSILIIFEYFYSIHQYVYIILYLGIVEIIIFIFNYYYLTTKYQISIINIKSEKVISIMKYGFDIFLSNFMVNIIINGNILILGVYASNVSLAIFSIAEKVMLIIKQLSIIFFQSIYSKAIQYSLKSVLKLQKTLTIFLVIIVFVFFIIGMLQIQFSYNIATFFSKNNVQEISKLVKWFSFLPLIVCTNMPAFITLVIYNEKKIYTNILIFATAFHILFCFIMSKYFGYKGTILSMYIVELLISILLNFFVIYKFKELFYLNYLYEKIKFRFWN